MSACSLELAPIPVCRLQAHDSADPHSLGLATYLWS